MILDNYSYTFLLWFYVDATTCLCKQYIHSRFAVAEDDWPPYQPKHYTTLALIHHKDCTDIGVISVIKELATKGDISRLSPVAETHIKATKSISDIFTFVTPSTSCPKMLLIEGAPGIGKTVLSKEIAFQWATKGLLNSIKFMLLVFLRNFHSGNIKSIESFMQHIFRKTRVANEVGDYLFKTSGEDLAIVFDGYDEISEKDRTDSFVADIIKRMVFPECLLVITSRPTASAHLHGIVNCRVEIVGFTEENRLEYIKAAMEDADEKVGALQLYLQSNPTINALCYIPLNMTILLCLSINGMQNLPKTQTELYKRFIEMTVTRFLHRQDDKIITANIDLLDLPHPHSEVFEELSQLAFTALQNDQLVFTLTELKASCPNLTRSPNNWNGLGLLQSVKYFNNGTEILTYHFLHFSIQEYMAACYISKLSDSKQIGLLKNTFWTIRYYNMWIMYVGITGGKSFALKHFFSGNWFQFFTWLVPSPGISKKLTTDKVKRLHVFQCLVETKNYDMISTLGQCFHNQEIDLSKQTLLPSHLNILVFFLIKSTCKRWNKLDLSSCNIGDTGCTVLLQWFRCKNTHCLLNIKHVDLSYNKFGFSSLSKLFEIFQSWCTSEIIITDNAIPHSTRSSQVYAAIENTFVQQKSTVNATLKLAVIGSFLFAYGLNQEDIFKKLSEYTIKSVYLLNINWDTSFPAAELLNNRVSELKNIHLLGTTVIENFTNAANMALQNSHETFNINSLFIYL